MTLSIDEQGQHLLDAIVFNVETKQWPNTAVKRVRLAYKLDINEFRGNTTLQLLVGNIEIVA